LRKIFSARIQVIRLSIDAAEHDDEMLEKQVVFMRPVRRGIFHLENTPETGWISPERIRTADDRVQL
jgi:hypothetical protein